jgi:hypothetical protein
VFGHCIEQVAGVVTVRSTTLDATMSGSPSTVEVGGLTWAWPLIATGAGASMACLCGLTEEGLLQAIGVGEHVLDGRLQRALDGRLNGGGELGFSNPWNWEEKAGGDGIFGDFV